MSSSHRRLSEERSVIALANNQIRMALDLRPQNPCDTKQLFLVATVGMEKVQKANSAIEMGPHADFDYLDEARRYLDEIKK